MIQIPEALALQEFSQLPHEVVNGQEVVIIGSDDSAFKLIALPRVPVPLFGSAKGQVSIGPDFNEPIEGIEAYVP